MYPCRAGDKYSCHAKSGVLRLLVSRHPSASVLFVADFLHPLNYLAVECFLNRDVRHSSRWRGAVPVPLFRRTPDHIAGTNFDFRLPSLCTQPQPAVTMSVCPSGCQCHAVCAPGSKVTLAPRTRAGSGASNNGSIRTMPVKYSSGRFGGGLCSIPFEFRDEPPSDCDSTLVQPSCK